MNPRVIDITNASRTVLMDAMGRCSPHLKPILIAMRDHACGYAIVMQDAGPFRLPEMASRPTVLLIGDDTFSSKGPEAFDPASLAYAVKDCGAAFIIASAAEADTYSKAVTWPILMRRHVAIIETLPKHEEAWVEFMLSAAPGVQVTISKVDPLARSEVQPWGRA